MLKWSITVTYVCYSKYAGNLRPRRATTNNFCIHEQGWFTCWHFGKSIQSRIPSGLDCTAAVHVLAVLCGRLRPNLVPMASCPRVCCLHY